MSLENFKITDEQISESGVVSAPDKLTGNASENKAVFDNLVRAVVAHSINNLISLLASPEAASVLGAKWPEGESANSLQEALDAAIVNSDEALEKAKEALDAANAASGTDLSNYVKKTDLATPGGDAGLVQLYQNPDYGVSLKSGCLAVSGAGNGTIDGKKNNNLPITPANLDYAMIRGLAYNLKTMTDTEKASALAFLGSPIVSISTYLGTGLAGSSNPTKVACNFNPDIVIVTTNYNRSGSEEFYPSAKIMTRDGFVSIHFRPGVSTSHPYMTSSASGKFSYVDGFISWHGANVHDQGCQAGVEYSVLAIGGNL